MLLTCDHNFTSESGLLKRFLAQSTNHIKLIRNTWFIQVTTSVSMTASSINNIQKDFFHCHKYSKSTLSFRNAVFIPCFYGEGKFRVMWVTFLKWNYSHISIRHCDCKCLLQLLTGYKQDCAGFWVWEDGVMRSVAPYVRFECNFNLEDKFSA